MFGILLLALTTISNGPLIEAWVDHEDGIYQTGEPLRISFRTDQDCYVAVYSIEVGGRESRLFPPDEDDGWVKANRTYQLPPEKANFDYIVSGPEGVETIIILASSEKPPMLEDDAALISRETIEIYIEEPEPARLRIITTPKYGQIFITEAQSGDGEYIGKAPRTLTIRPGEYIIEIRKYGYRTLERRIWLDPGEHRRIFVKLFPY
ncbi:hypothetical protein A2Y85_04290 [candidate division WOR-3 bacterium RBG_13_43_14]|uniref:PEGA domain-containing protein n=1 Tax=candidate division WOR-3 bacterium RBG_13_43_14 TaxID=1802590 RepID=A0A1F4UF04_UNCW3|nr:MAG: hypothetical protein A2Y85_04290 [candidate division WOR-3 bacterium RBG_13_43_14]